MQEKQENKVPELPVEIWDHLISFVTIPDLFTLELVSRTLREVASSETAWKRVTGDTKEKFREYATSPFVYTILNIPFQFMPEFKSLKCKIIENEIHSLFNTPEALELCIWPQILSKQLENVPKNAPRNKIFNSKEELEATWTYTRRNFIYTAHNYRHGRFFMEYKQIGDKVHITALKFYSDKEYTTFKHPIVINRSQINNFPSAPVPKALPVVAHGGRNGLFPSQPLNQNAQQNEEPEKNKKRRCVIS